MIKAGTSARRKVFNPETDQLLYLDLEANQNFWDQKWAQSAKYTFLNPPRHRATIKLTNRFLPVGSRILEGGCGLGDVVHALSKAGYEAYGIDYAPKIVEEINKNWPHLNVKQGDVRRLPVGNGYYDGYWSIGVIEHFSEGYDSIIREMARVVKKGGYLFLSFPSFNRFRQRRASLGKYPISLSSASDFNDFFQFALAPQKVEDSLQRFGFEAVDRLGIGTLQCLAEDLPFYNGIQSLLRYFPSRFETASSMLMDRVIGKYAGHSCLLVMQKICN